MSVDESGRRSYLPGDWFGIFGERAAVLLPQTEKRRVGALWELLDGGAGFDEALDALIATGLRDLPGFVLVSDDDGSTRIVVRGAARASFQTAEGPVEIDPAGAGTWVERTLVGVTSTVLEVSPDATDTDTGAGSAPAPMTLLTGLVRVSRVQTPAGAEPQASGDTDGGVAAGAGALGAAAAVATPAAVAAPDDVEPDPGPPADHDALSDPAYAEEPAPEPEPEPEPEPAARLDEPTEALSFADLHDEPAPPGIATEPEPAPAPEPGPPAAPAFGSGPPPERPQWAPAPTPENPFGAGPGAPGPGGPGPGGPGPGGLGGPPPPAPAWGDAVPPPEQLEDQAPPEAHGPGQDPAADHDGDTNAGDYDPSVFARSQPGIPGQPPAPSVTARPVARLLMSNGETLDVDRAILIGRAPEARRFTADTEPRLVTVPSPHQEISSTHLEVRPGSGADHGSAVVTDMGSTNGTVLVQPGLPPEDLQPGLTVQLIPGAVIDLGDGLTIQVANP